MISRWLKAIWLKILERSIDLRTVATYIDMVNASLGFSPAEIVFSRQMHGPLYLAREVWQNPEGPKIAGQKDVVTYVRELRDRLQRNMKSVKENVDFAREVQRRYYDRKSTPLKRKAGDQVQVLQPSCNSKMFARYVGPIRAHVT